MIEIALLVLLVVLLGLTTANTRVLREYQRGVLFRLGRLRPLAGPGLVFLIPFVDRMERVDLRTVTMTIPPQEVITRDNVPARVNAVAYFRVTDPARAITEVEQYPVATSQIAQTTLRSVLGRAELDDLLAERDQLNDSLRRIIDEQTEPWGIKVTTVEIKDVEIPEAMQRAMARQAEAERERRAKIINAEGEFQAAQKIYDAAEILSRNPAALQLRYLQTLLELGGEKSTIVFPLPMDLIKPFLGTSGQAGGTPAAPPLGLSILGGPLGRLLNGAEPFAAEGKEAAAGAGKRQGILRARTDLGPATATFGSASNGTAQLS
jgi:regulator of protease activity HflC (stomatin/prohibitin superfamily)